MFRFLRERRERELAALGEFRSRRKVVAEDVTIFGEQLTELHFDTLSTELDAPLRGDYQSALDAYETAKERLHTSATTEDLAPVRAALTEGRYFHACVLARQVDQPLPQRLAECFFNPQHGPSLKEVAWTPPNGTQRLVPVCRADASRLANDELPEIRMVRVGDRWVPWFVEGTEYARLGRGFDEKAVHQGVTQAAWQPNWINHDWGGYQGGG
jgi:hypothetical protein